MKGMNVYTIEAWFSMCCMQREINLSSCMMMITIPYHITRFPMTDFRAVSFFCFSNKVRPDQC